MKAFSNCQLVGVNPVMLFLHSVVVEEFAAVGKPWAITSGVRRQVKGKKKSKHTAGLALDYRSRHLDAAERATIHANVRRRVAGTFDFIFETTLRDPAGKLIRFEHFHGEYDPK